MFLCCWMLVLSAGCTSPGSIQSGKQDPAKSSGNRQEPTAETVGKAAGEDPAKLELPPPDKLVEQAPAEFRVRFETTKGDFVVLVNRKWSPNAADRFFNLVKAGYFRDIAIFRAIRGFMCQFGIHGDPAVSAVYSEASFQDDEYTGISNTEGKLTFARTGEPHSRSTQLFINLGDNRRLDQMGFTPFAEVVEGIEVVREINTEYGENPPNLQGNFQQLGNEYLRKNYPNLDYIRSITIVEPDAGSAPSNPIPDASAQPPSAGGGAKSGG